MKPFQILSDFREVRFLFALILCCMTSYSCFSAQLPLSLMLQKKISLDSCKEMKVDIQIIGLNGFWKEDPFKCLVADVDTIEVRSFYVDGTHGPLRVITLEDSRHRANQAIILLSGGPRVSSIPFDADDLRGSTAVALARSNALVIAVDHLGTKTRSFYPKSDVEPSAEEVTGLANSIRRVPSIRLEGVVAASIDALIGVKIVSRIKLKTVLLSPPFGPVEALIKSDRSDLAPNYADRSISFAVTDRVTGDFHQETTTNFEQMKAFSGRDFSRPLEDIISDIPRNHLPCATVVFGTDDRRIMVDRASRVAARFPSLKMTSVNGVGHRPKSAAQAQRLASVILSSFADGRCQGKIITKFGV